jgi:hypothetical protein
MERFAGFTGTSYASGASDFAIEKTVNFYQETGEVPGLAKGEGPILLPTPALASYGVNPPQVPGRARGKIEFNGLAYGVNGTSFYFIQSNGAQTHYGNVIDDGNPVIMAASKPTIQQGNGQVAVASGGHLYIYSGGGFQEIPIGDDFFGADYVTWLDGYFIVLQKSLSQFQISALDDGTQWNGADVSGTLGQADVIQALIADKEYLYLLGSRRGEIWYDTGNNLFPFGIESGAFIEDGIGAAYSLCQSDNSIYWFNQSARGGLQAVRSEGLITRRISTHAMEVAWANKDPNKGKVYATTADCITYSFIWNGHTFIKWIFPTADASWLYDATESDSRGYSVWTESTFTDLNGNTHACLERDHCYAYGLHICGSGGADGAAGTLYTLDGSTCFDAPNPEAIPTFDGFPIIRDRVVRLPWNGGLRQFLDRLEFEIQRGIGLDDGQGSDPELMLRISRDGGKTWGREIRLKMGAGGKYQTRVIANRLGSYRDGALWLRISDPVFAALIGAEHYIRQGVS